jgi:putative dimethyl sulfoxide reductase chaperone
MSEQDTIDDVALIALARSRVYAMLAAAFRYPVPEFYSDIESGRYADNLTETVTAIFSDLEDQIAGPAVTLCAATSLCDQEADYLRIFETDMPKPAVSLYEGMSTNAAERIGILLELKAFFSQFGLTMNKELGELEDNLTAELEFMQFLAAKEAEAIQTGRDPKPYRLAQCDFLTRHLGAWLPSLAQSAGEVTSSFYRSAALIAAMFVQHDQIAVVQGLRDQAPSGAPFRSTQSTGVCHEIQNTRY